MATEPADLIGPRDTAFTLDLTAAQLKVVHTALKSMLDDFGHDQPDVHGVIREVLAKLPDEPSIRAIDLDAELRRGESAKRFAEANPRSDSPST
jgi:hypothetical protein